MAWLVFHIRYHAAQETLCLSYENHLINTAVQGSDPSLLWEKLQPMDTLCMH
jgi:hypothetical protein